MMSYLDALAEELLKLAAPGKFFNPKSLTPIRQPGFGSGGRGHVHTQQSARAAQLRASKPDLHRGVELTPAERQAYHRYLSQKAQFQNKSLDVTPRPVPAPKPKRGSGTAEVFTEAEREAYRKSLRQQSSLSKEAAKRVYTATDLDRAGRRQDLEAQQFRREYKGPPPTPEEREAVRELAQKTINLPIQKGKKVTLKQWMDRILKVLVTRRPEVREKILAAIKEQLKHI
jgi:hypothetical protein